MSQLQEITRQDPQDWPRILLMEDEPSVAKGLQMVLTEEGYAVDLAMTGQSALDRFTQKGFDLLVADLRLPDIDGMEVIKRVKARRPQTSVVVITGYSTVTSAIEAMKLGAHDYLPKPFTDEEFKSAVEGALKAKKTAPARDFIEKVDTEEGRLIQKQEVIRVLTRASQDEAFWQDLLKNGSAALKDYKLSPLAKAAIISGDLDWIHRNVGKLTEKQLEWIRSRLEMERW
ncbi:MAG: response regulator [Thermodesulfobacteriota bacterium]